MTWTSFFIIFAVCTGTIVFFRVFPMLVLAGRELPSALESALGYIPVAAFAALVANDLFFTGALAQGAWAALMPFIASAAVVVCARATKSLVLCIVVGVGAYALLMLL